MNITMVVIILVAGFAAESFILSRAQERAENEEIVMGRLARYAGRQLEEVKDE